MPNMTDDLEWFCLRTKPRSERLTSNFLKVENGGGILSVCSVPASAAFRQALGDGGDVSRLCFCQVSLYFAMSADPSYARRGRLSLEKFKRGTAPEIISELRKAVQDRETIVIQPGIEVGEEVNVVAARSADCVPWLVA